MNLYERGRYAEAIAIGQSMLEGLSSDDLRARIRLQLALSQLQFGRTDLVKPLLAQACQHFEAVDDAEMLAKCAAARASTACVEQGREALELALAALDACRSLNHVPHSLELEVLNCVGSAQWLFGQRTEALKTFQQASQLADPVLDMRRLGKLLDCAGLAYAELGHMGTAVLHCTRALALFETLNDVVSLARTANNLGWVLMGAGHLVAARMHLERSLRLFEETSLWHARSTVLCSLCEVCLAEGDIHHASTYADAAIVIAQDQNEAWSIAEARMLKGRIAAMRLDDEAADSEFQAALAALETSGMAERLAACRIAYAETLEDRGDLRQAYEQLQAAFRVTRERGSL